MKILYFLSYTVLLALTLPAQTVPAPLVPDEHTLFALGADPASGTLTDRTGKVKKLTAEGRVVHDAVAGPCLEFPSESKGGIVIPDDGLFDFSQGMTLDAWIRLDTPPDKNASFALKVGSFAWSLDKARLTAAWQVFPRAEIFTTTPTQYPYYSFGMETMNGLYDVPLREWVRLTISYDTSLGCVTTLINGMVDRRRYRAGGPEPLQCDPKKPLTMLSGLAGCRVASVKCSSGRPSLVPPGMEVWLNALPYRGQMMITLDHIDARLPLPIEVAISAEKASGGASTLRRLRLDSHARRDLIFNTPEWPNSIHSFTVSAAAGGVQVFQRTLRASNVKPSGRTLVHADHSISRDGRKFFPILAYHAMPEDYALLAELGFNIIHNDFNLSQAHGHRGEARDKALLECLDAAAKHQLFLIPSANSVFGNLHVIGLAKNHSATLLWYHADEPWGDIGRLQDSYNAIKMLEPHLPLFIVQNNPGRLQDTAVAADILAMDPYPIPNVSLRSVASSTKASIRAVADQKPVWTVLPQYETKLPTLEELRSMLWLALASGANGLGIYAWDDRVRDPKKGTYSGWYTREHPEHVSILRAALTEVRAHEAVLLAPRAERQPEPSRNPAIHAFLRQADGKRWLILANDSRRAEEGEIDLGAPSDAKARSLFGAGEGFSFAEGKTRLRLPALGVGLYELE
jgi:hypothetical protein